MPRQKLSTILSALHEQLQNDKPVDREDKLLLAAVLHDIEAKLASDSPSDADSSAPSIGSLGERIQDSIGRFEADHPALTKNLHDLVETLKQI